MRTRDKNYKNMMNYIKFRDQGYASSGQHSSSDICLNKSEPGEEGAFEDKGFRRAHSCRGREIWIRQHGDGTKCRLCGRIARWDYADRPQRETLVLRCRPEQEALMRDQFPEGITS